MKKILLTISLFFTVVNFSFAIKESKIPFRVKKAILETNYDLDKLSWKKHSDDIYEAFDTKNKAYFSVFISKEGELLLKEEKIIGDSLPPIIKQKLIGHNVKSIYKITDYELNIVSYDIHSIKDKERYKVLYDENGTKESYHISKKHDILPFFAIILLFGLIGMSF